MSTMARRVLITAAVISLLLGITGLVLTYGRTKPPTGTPSPAGAPASTGTQAPAGTPSPAGTQAATGAPTPAPAAPSAKGWSARPPGQVVPAGVTLGGLDSTKHTFQLEIAPNGVGVQRVVFSDYWRTAEQSRMARKHNAAVARGEPSPPPLPPEEDRYQLHSTGTLAGVDVSLLAARFLEVDGEQLVLFGPLWSQTGPGQFQTSIVDANGTEQLRVTRTFTVQPGSFDVALEQRVANTGTAPRTVRWIQNAPSDLARDPGQLVDTRRFQSGYLWSPEHDKAQETVIVHGALLDHSSIIKQIGAGDPVVWPNPQQAEEKYGLSWFGSTNRYFALAVHAPYAPPTVTSKLIAPAVAEIGAQQGSVVVAGVAEPVVYTYSRSAALTIPPGGVGAFDMGFFAGPLDSKLLSTAQPFAALNMQGLILYLMSGCCSFCTFAWLADGLIAFLMFLHSYVVFDWALAIIVLVAVVRLVLHPLTKRSQISMQRVSKQMQALKPELDALKDRYKNDPKKLQEEQVRIYRERGVNPLGCAGGMLPTFLQMPIWMALYAMLYFAFELRQQPAFFGVFQQLGGWGFLGDLSEPDHFIPLGVNLNLYIVQITSINLIPLLMGVVFFVQQKYMTPPPSGPVSKEMESQQKIMKWMMVLLFPLMLYNAPSGLTLYIATSTLVGVFEGMQVRKAVEKMDFTKPPKGGGGRLARWLQDLQARAAGAAAQQQPTEDQRKELERQMSRAAARRYRER